ncbi:MAG: hypothetical protein ALAOOOJD_00701 [bacterium]|nr:hypothetical protein [bacterium]
MLKKMPPLGKCSAAHGQINMPNKAIGRFLELVMAISFATSDSGSHGARLAPNDDAPTRTSNLRRAAGQSELAPWLGEPSSSL